MVFSLSIPILDVVKPMVDGNPIPAQAIPFSAGIIIVTNNKIFLSDD